MKKQTILTLGICALAFGAVAGAVSAQRALETKAAAPENIYVSFGAESAWKNWGAKAANTKVHFWGASGDLDTFPGNAVTEVTVSDVSYFKIAVPSGATGMVVTVWDGKTAQNKTEDLTVPTDGKNWFTVTSNNDGALQTGTWSTLDTSSETTPDPVEAVYYLAGSFNEWGKAVGKDEWKLTKNGDKYEITGVNLKKNASLKVTDGSDWFPEDNVSIAEDGKYTITLDGKNVTATKTGEYDGEITEVEYFLAGSFNKWEAKDATYKFAKMDEKKDEKDQYKLGDVELKKDDLLKVNDSDGVWYPGGAGGNYTVSEDGTYDIYFVPEGGITDWTDNGYFYVAKQESGEGEGGEGGEGGEEITETLYYLVGSINEWSTGDDYKFAKMDEKKNEKDQYKLGDVELKKDDELKVKDSKGAWYPDGGDNFTVTADGTYDIYFVPEGGITDEGWFGGYFYLAKQEAPTPDPVYTCTVAGNPVTLVEVAPGEFDGATCVKKFRVTITAADGAVVVFSKDGTPIAPGATGNIALVEDALKITKGGAGISLELKVYEDGGFATWASEPADADLAAVREFVEKYIATPAAEDYKGIAEADRKATCATKYDTAKTELAKLSPAQQALFNTEDEFIDARATLAIWEAAKGNIDGAMSVNSSKGKSTTAIVVASVVAVGAISAGAMLFFSRKRKANK